MEVTHISSNFGRELLGAVWGDSKKLYGSLSMKKPHLDDVARPCQRLYQRRHSIYL